MRKKIQHLTFMQHLLIQLLPAAFLIGVSGLPGQHHIAGCPGCGF